MANENFQWVFELIDKVSGSGKNVINAFKGISGGAAAAGKAHESMFAKVAGGIHVFHDLEHIVGMTKRAFSEAAEMVVGFFEEAGKMQQSVATLKILTGSGEIAKAVYEDLSRVAGKTGLSIDVMANAAKGFAVAGFNIKEMHNLFTAMADVAVLSGHGAEGAAQFGNMIKGITTGVEPFSRQLRTLNMLNIPSSKIYANIAESLHVGLKDAEKLAKLDLVPRTIVTNAIVHTVAQMQGGWLGTFAQENAGTLLGLMARITIQAKRLFEGVDPGPVTRMLEQIETALNPDGPTGKILSQFLDTIGAGIGAFGESFVKEVSKNMLPALQDLNSEAGKKQLIELFRSAGVVAGDLLSILLKLSGVVGAIANPIAKTIAAWTDKGTGVNFTKGALADIAAGMTKGVSDVAPKVQDNFALADIAAGMTKGVSDVVPEVQDNFVALAQAGQTSFTKEMGIKSPSSVFEEYGALTGEGFAKGLDSSGSGIANSVANMVSLPGGGSFKGQGVTANVTVNVNASGDAQELAEKTKEATLSAVFSAFEELGIEGGAA